jgi:hypothetical protein
VVGTGLTAMEEDRVLAAPIGFVVVVSVCHGLGGCNLFWASILAQYCGLGLGTISYYTT